MCEYLEKELYDVDAEDFEVTSSVHLFPDHTSDSPREMLDHIYKKELYGRLSMFQKMVSGSNLNRLVHLLN